MQREHGDLRRAVKPEGNTHCADAAINVHLQAAEAEPPLDILASHLGQNYWTDQRQANLAAVVWPQSMRETA